jgi:SAM-dependent methyltransferase
MEQYEPAMSFGEDAAASYDDEPRGDEDEAVAFLAQLAGGGPALELAIGTGRIALPLAATGIRVDGIDISPHMVERLRAKPGGDALEVTMGDFAAVPVTGSYPLIYVVYNTFNNLLTQDDQVRCFENVAAHLTENGSFLIEAGVPNFLHKVFDDQYVHAESIGLDEVWLDVGRHDPVTQTHEETHVRLSAESVQLFPIVQRYTWPSELDLMARLAGLRLKERWDGWNRDPFTSTGNVVSVYGR